MKRLCKAARELGSFGADDRGAELVEWMLVTLVAGLAGYALLAAVRDDLARVFEHVLGGFVDWLS